MYFSGARDIYSQYLTLFWRQQVPRNTGDHLYIDTVALTRRTPNTHQRKHFISYNRRNQLFHLFKIPCEPESKTPFSPPAMLILSWYSLYIYLRPYETPVLLCVEPRAGLDDMTKRKFFTLPGLALWSLCRPAHSQPLYRLRYPGYSRINKGSNNVYYLVHKR
jgi:hypothetical protein